MRIANSLRSGDQDLKNISVPNLHPNDSILIDIIWREKHKKASKMNVLLALSLIFSGAGGSRTLVQTYSL